MWPTECSDLPVAHLKSAGISGIDFGWIFKYLENTDVEPGGGLLKAKKKKLKVEVSFQSSSIQQYKIAEEN